MKDSTYIHELIVFLCIYVCYTYAFVASSGSSSSALDASTHSPETGCKCSSTVTPAAQCPPSAPVSRCPDGWVTYADTCYLFGHQQHMTFHTAMLFCLEHGAHLVNVGDRAEDKFLKDYISRLVDRYFWIGLTDRDTEGTWIWYDTNMAARFQDWAIGEPNNIGIFGEDCAAYSDTTKQYRWFDVPCSKYDVQPLCEMAPKVDSTPTIV